jgi:3-oxoacyl-[acyl-carrier protein] reductase
VSDYLDRLVASRGIGRDQAYAEIASRIPLGRIPEASEVAGAVLFMASDLAAVVTGQTLDVNGGQVMY